MSSSAHDVRLVPAETTDPKGQPPVAQEADDGALDEVLTPEEVARLLKIPERTLADWRYRREGPPFRKVGRHVRYLGTEVRAWLDCQ